MPYMGVCRSPDSDILFGMKTFFGKSWDHWIAEYAESHQHPANRFCHTVGIPLILTSLPLLAFSPLWPVLFLPGILLFIAGWIFQFVGHIFEGKPPEFFRDWRFLFVGVRWWLAKIRGRA